MNTSTNTSTNTNYLPALDDAVQQWMARYFRSWAFCTCWLSSLRPKRAKGLWKLSFITNSTCSIDRLWLFFTVLSEYHSHHTMLTNINSNLKHATGETSRAIAPFHFFGCRIVQCSVSTFPSHPIQSQVNPFWCNINLRCKTLERH